jgi:cobalamin 5'-phosphate synthase/cobalamin synthase
MLLICAIAFLTRLPVGRGREFDAKTVARATRWFPAVGALLGAIYALAARLLAFFFPAPLTAAAIVALDAALTGAIHLDGLADTADGFGGGRTREDVLRIMRDHAVGSYGAVAIVLALGVRAAAVAALVGTDGIWGGLILAPVLGRWAAVLIGGTQPYARSSDAPGAGEPARFMGRTELAIATLTAAAAAVAFGWRGAGAGLAVAMLAGLWGRRSARRIGGVTGDTLGAGVIAAECLVLALFAAAMP